MGLVELSDRFHPAVWKFDTKPGTVWHHTSNSDGRIMQYFCFNLFATNWVDPWPSGGRKLKPRQGLRHFMHWPDDKTKPNYMRSKTGGSCIFVVQLNQIKINKKAKLLNHTHHHSSVVFGCRAGF